MQILENEKLSILRESKWMVIWRDRRKERKNDKNMETNSNRYGHYYYCDHNFMGSQKLSNVILYAWTVCFNMNYSFYKAVKMVLHLTKSVHPNILWKCYIEHTIALLMPSEGQCWLSRSQYWWTTKDIAIHFSRNSDWITKAET